MTATNLTASIAGTIYPVLNTTYTLDDIVDARSTLQLTIFDANNTYNFLPFQPVTITDTLEGIKFTGFVAKPIATKYDASNALSWQLSCVDNEFLAGKKTSNRIINNQYAGIAAASMVNDHLSQDGVTANYAVRDDNNQLEFAQGTLNGTQATGNLGGDLELAPAGSTVTITEATTSAFNAGSLTNMSASNNTIGPSATSSIKIQATQSAAAIANSYTYVKIWSGSVGIITGRYLEYDIWINSTSPEAKIGVDLTFTDGTSYRDLATSNNGLWFDQQNKSPHPNTDLKGLAVDQWYHRKFLLDNFTSKTIAYVTVACEGDSGGIYTGYIKNVLETNGSGTTINTFFGGSFNVNPPQQMQKQGYASTSVTSVNTYDCITAQRVSPSYSIDLAKILKSSFLTYKTTLPTGYTFNLSYTIDGGNSYTPITNDTNIVNNIALPNMLAGQSIAGKSIQFLQSFNQDAGSDPSQKPLLNSMQASLYPSYTATKTDINGEWTTNSQWNAGTFSNTQASNNILAPFGAIKNWDNADLSGQTLFGGAATGPNNANSCFQYVDSKQFRMEVHQSTEARSRLDIAGSWGNFQMEFDVYIDNGLMKVGCFYRTTGTSNYDAQYAYAVEIFGTTIALQRGSNSSAASAGTRTQVATATIGLTSQAIHRVKVIANGSNHQIYVDDVLYINATDSTYTGSGNVGFRVSNTDASNGYISLFDNFGISPTSLGGTWTSQSVSLTGAGTYGGSTTQWNDVSTDPSQVNNIVQSSVDGGSTYQTLTNGGSIPNLTLGQSLSGVSVRFKITFSANSSTVLPEMQYLTAYILGGFSSSGTRIAPFLSLSNALIAGSTLTSWVATTPANTSVAVSTSLDGISYSSATNGGGITGSNSQPSPTLDTFGSNSSPNYTQTIRTGGSAGVFFWDTLNSRLSVSGGTNALLLLTAISCKDVDLILDFDQSDRSGLVWRWNDASDFYELDIFDASSSAGAANIIRLFKVISTTSSLTLYGSSVADATLTNACDMAVATGGVETSKTTTMTGFAGGVYGEILSRGGSSTGVASIPSTPTGNGWVYKPGAGIVPPGNWSASITVSSNSWGGSSSNTSITAIFSKYSNGVYSPIGSLPPVGITGTSKTTYTFAATAMPGVTFAANDLIYVGLWWSDNNTTVNNDNPVIYESTSSSSGVTNDMQITTPGISTGSVKTQLGSDVAVTLTRGYKYRLHLSMVGTAINVLIDGVSLISTTDASLSATGQVGIIEATGVGRFYNFRVQPQGDNLSGKVVYSKVTLGSTDPLQTPQLTGLTVAALHPNIDLGSLIPNADYTNTYVSDNIKDLAKKSDYTTYFDQNLNFIFGPRVAQPAPWILQSADQKLLIAGPLTVDYSADLYRNEMVLQGVVATGTKSEIKIGDGNTTSWALGGELIATPIILLNNQAQTVGVKGIDTGKNFYWTPGSNAIDQDPSGTILQQTDTLLFQNYTYQYITSITVDNTNLANTVTQKQFAQRMGRTFAIQNVYNGTSSAHTTSSDAGDLDVSKCRRIAVDINITAVSGTAPTIQFFVDRKDTNGIYYNLWSSSSVNTTGQTSVTIGAFATINQALGAIARLRWTIGGTTPSFTFSASVAGILDVQSAGLGIVAVVEDVSSQSLNVAAAAAYGNGLLQRYGTQGRLISFKTWRRNPSLSIGQYIPVFIPEYNINDASMLITEISTTQDIGYESGTPTQVYWQVVTITESANMGNAWKLLSSNLK